MVETASRLIVIDGISTASTPTTYTLSECVLCEGGKMLVNYESEDSRDTEKYN